MDRPAARATAGGGTRLRRVQGAGRGAGRMPAGSAVPVQVAALGRRSGRVSRRPERFGPGASTVRSGQPEVGYAHRRTPTCAFEFPIPIPHPLHWTPLGPKSKRQAIKKLLTPGTRSVIYAA